MKQNQILKTKCKPCKALISHTKKFIMDGERLEWNCDNCGSEYKVIGATHERPEQTDIAFFITKDGETRKFYFENGTKTIKEVQ